MFELLNFSRKKKMAVLSIRRDWGQNPCIVRMEVDADRDWETLS